MSRQRNVNHELLCRSQLMTLLSVKFLLSRQRNVNHELLCRSQLMTLLSVKFLFVREGVATDDEITEKTRGKGRGGKEALITF